VWTGKQKTNALFVHFFRAVNIELLLNYFNISGNEIDCLTDDLEKERVMIEQVSLSYLGEYSVFALKLFSDYLTWQRIVDNLYT
jgi:hypothetical protein